MEQMLELTEEDAVTPELLDSQVQKAQEQLLQLRRQQEQIEKQKRELEELSRRQEELERGRAEMTDKLTRSLVVLEREAYETQKKLEQLRATRESFGQHLEILEGIDPKGWNPTDLHRELSRALSTVDDARAEFSQQRSRLQAIATQDAEDVSLPEAAPEVVRGGGERLVRPMGSDRIRPLAPSDHGWIDELASLLVDGQGLRLRMIRRSPKSGSAVDKQQEELARRENALRDQMQKLQRMIDDAPRLAQETSRKQREELLERANQRGSRLDVSLSLHDKRWDDNEWGVRRPGSLRKERREGRIIFLVLVIALTAAVLWLMTRFHF